MTIIYKKLFSRHPSFIGKGFLNKIINKLPIELHLPGYQFCGPGTKLKKRLARGDQGINPLDTACREHDIAYSNNKDLEKRHIADRILTEKAWQRVKASDSSLGEKSNAWFVATAMKAKTKFGMGNVISKTKKSSPVNTHKLFTHALKSARKNIKKSENLKDAIKISRKVVNNIFKGKKKSLIKTPRIIPLPKSGGFLPLAPIFAALGALGGLAGGVSGITKAINAVKNGKEQLTEAKRHNNTMEAIAMGKGMFLKPYKKGFGLYLKPYQQNF